MTPDLKPGRPGADSTSQQVDNKPQVDCTGPQLDKKLRAKKERLSPGIRKYIRRLKESGRWDEAIKLGQIRRDEKRNRIEVAAEELEKTITEVICEEDLLKEASGQIKVIWLLNAVGVLSTDERREEMISFLNSVPQEIQTPLEEKLPAIRDGVKQFMPLMPLAG